MKYCVTADLFIYLFTYYELVFKIQDSNFVNLYTHVEVYFECWLDKPGKSKLEIQA